MALDGQNEDLAHVTPAITLPDDLTDPKVREIAMSSRGSLVAWAGTIATFTVTAGVITLQILGVQDEHMHLKALAAHEGIAGLTIYGLLNR